MTYPSDPAHEHVAAPVGPPSRGGSRPRPGWAPRWALAVTWTALALLCAPAVLSAGFVLNDLATTGEKFDGMGLALGASGLVATGVVAAPLAWFLRRGGKAAFWLGAVLSVTLVAYVLSLGFDGLLTGFAISLLLAIGVLSAAFAWARLNRRSRSAAPRAAARR